MHTLTTEEKCPLLLVYMDDGNEPQRNTRNVLYPERKGSCIAAGAVKLMHHWPEHVSSCWFSAVALSSLLIVFTMMMLLFTINPVINHLHMRCARDAWSHTNNKSIHLTHYGTLWSQDQLQTLRFIASTFTDYEIHLNIFEKIKQAHHHMQLTTTKNIHTIQNDTNATTRPMVKDDLPTDIFDSTFIKKLLGRLQRSIMEFKQKIFSLDGVLHEHKNIYVKNRNFQEYFDQTPLRLYWKDFSIESLLFAARINELWQYVGISFYMPPNKKNIHHKHNGLTKSFNFQNMNQLKAIITKTKSRYLELSENTVSIDLQGLHMATITPCHHFFAEMLINMQKSSEPIKTSQIIQNVLDIFCKKFGMESAYCKAIRIY